MHEQMPYFVGWGTLSLINAGLAQSKGRDGFIWWFSSLFLGPIATLLIVLFPPIQPKKAAEKQDTEPTADAWCRLLGLPAPKALRVAAGFPAGGLLRNPGPETD
jgi:hypothetical protein